MLGPLSNVPHASTNRVDFSTFESSGHDCLIDTVFMSKLSHGSARGGVAAEGTSCMHGTKKM